MAGRKKAMEQPKDEEKVVVVEEELLVEETIALAVKTSVGWVMKVIPKSNHTKVRGV